MSTEPLPETPEEAVTALSRQVAEGTIGRQELLRELLKLGLGEQKRWKAIRLLDRGVVDETEAARIAHTSVERLRKARE